MGDENNGITMSHQALIITDCARLVERCQQMVSKVTRGESVRGDALAMRELHQNILENAYAIDGMFLNEEKWND